jgi:LysR family hydrogen peroxide-inducible transcriptional activator
VELDQLRYFLKVAEFSSFTRAAEDLLVSQPALSRSIGRLEEEVGQPVFERQSRSVVLTEAGVKFQTRAIQILGMVENARAELHDDGQSGTVRLGAIPTVAPYWMPERIRQFLAEHPRCNITLREDVTERLVQACNQGEIDAAILALPVERGYLQHTKIIEEELKLAIPRQHPLAKKAKVDFADLDREPLLMLGAGHCLSEQIDAYCQRRSIAPVKMEKTMQLSTILELVSLGQGLAFIPVMACVNDPKRRRVFRSIVSKPPRRTIVFLWNPNRYESKLMAAFRASMTS